MWCGTGHRFLWAPVSSREVRGIANPFLAGLAVLLLLTAIAGFLLEKNSEVIGAFLFFGVVLAVFAAIEPRMEGKQEIGWRRATMNLARSKQVRRALRRADEQLAAGKGLKRAEDVLRDN